MFLSGYGSKIYTVLINTKCGRYHNEGDLYILTLNKYNFQNSDPLLNHYITPTYSVPSRPQIGPLEIERNILKISVMVEYMGLSVIQLSRREHSLRFQCGCELSQRTTHITPSHTI